MHVLGGGDSASSLNTRGEEIWYGVLEMHTSKYGSGVVLITSPRSNSRRGARGVPWTRFVTSAAMRGSISMAMQRRDFSRMRTVRFPVPGPTSRTIYAVLVVVVGWWGGRGDVRRIV